MKCPSCGSALDDDAAFCQHCGAKVSEADPSSPRGKLSDATRRDHGDEEDEVVVWEGQYSGKAMYGSWITAALISVGLLVAAFFLQPFTMMWSWAIAGGLIVVMWFVLIVRLLLTQWSVNYQLTTQRFIHRKGLFSRLVDRLEVIDIDDVSFRQGLINRIVNVGTITIISSDRSHPELQLPGIADVERVADLIDDVRRKERRRRGIHIESI